MNRVTLVLTALRELGPRQLGLYARYQIGLRSGYYRRLTQAADSIDCGLLRTDLLDLPSAGQLQAILGEKAGGLLNEADEIVAGQIRLFGGNPQPLQLALSEPLGHWTEYEGKFKKATNRETIEDIKFVWEPARFGWAYILGRAYLLTGDERYSQTFWRHTEAFLDASPPYQGAHWASGQEVALRLIAFVFASQVFTSLESAVLKRLAQAVAEHAARLPVTLAYSRAQNNNHLLSEAAGLYTAGLALPQDPRATSWRQTGWRWLQHGLQRQIAPDGAYIQHSNNYHRLMLQLALWVAAISPEPYPPESAGRLAMATQWLLALVDPCSGEVPNLGPNDGSYILPLSTGAFQDYRPTLQAAGDAFLGYSPFPGGPWDELSAWLPPRSRSEPPEKTPAAQIGPCALRNTDGKSWAYLRLARFTSRPGHADQLHLDLWWQGHNLAGDPGTYRYTASPPWDNALVSAAVHNTVTVNGQDQMARAGRFLYLDWAQGRLIDGQRSADGVWQRVAARHAGYRRLGVDHLRMVDASQAGRWHIEDLLIPVERELARMHTPFRLRVHWLLPDWPWELEGTSLRLESPLGKLELRVQPGQEGLELSMQLVRAGELLQGSGPISPTWGWRSPTYAIKQPALSFSVTAVDRAPLSLTSEWILPG